MRALQTILSDLVFLLYPEYCLACSVEVPVSQHAFCLDCLFHIPFTDHFDNYDNDFLLHFLGRQQLECGLAIFQLQKGGRVHDMLSKLKYRNRRDIGFTLGKMFGELFIQSNQYKEVDYIIPVPLHRLKKRKRGYNQSEVFAQGIATHISAEVNSSCLLKVRKSDSQTRKNRNQRLENVFDSFVLQNEELLINKHILLVDDIVTTGATLEACIMRLKVIEGIRISLGAIAITE